MTVETEEAAPAGADAGATTSRARWDASDVSIRLVVVMLVITAVIAVLGWQYRPGTGAYPAVPRRLALSVTADAHSLVMTLARTGSDGAVLTLYDDDAIQVGGSSYGATPGRWKIGIDGLGTGTVVRDPGPGLVPVPPGQTAFDHTRLRLPQVHRVPRDRPLEGEPVPAESYRPVAAHAPLYLEIRWHDHAPVVLDGAYLSAQMPSVQLFWPDAAPASIPMATTLLPRAGDVGQFSLQATQGPSVTGPRSWTWHEEAPAITAPNALQPIARFDPIAFSAVNVSETQQENVRAFIAGVLLGIAGGAVITLIAELVKLRRIGRTDPSPGG